MIFNVKRRENNLAILLKILEINLFTKFHINFAIKINDDGRRLKLEDFA